MEVEFEKEYAEVRYVPSSRIIEGTLSSAPESEAFRRYMRAILYVLRKKPTQKLLVDTSSASGNLNDADRVWAIEQWAPKAIDAGLAYQALVLDETVAEVLSLDDLIESNMSDEVTQSVFAKRDEAREWLENQSEAE